MSERPYDRYAKHRRPKPVMLTPGERKLLLRLVGDECCSPRVANPPFREEDFKHYGAFYALREADNE